MLEVKKEDLLNSQNLKAVRASVDSNNINASPKRWIFVSEKENGREFGSKTMLTVNSGTRSRRPEHNEARQIEVKE